MTFFMTVAGTGGEVSRAMRMWVCESEALTRINRSWSFLVSPGQLVKVQLDMQKNAFNLGLWVNFWGRKELHSRSILIRSVASIYMG
jgi:hypothetical protein